MRKTINNTARGIRLKALNIIVLLNLVCLAMALTPAWSQEQGMDCPAPRYTFSWSLEDRCGQPPRGGTTTGAPVALDPEPHPGWLALQEEGLSGFERDRRAILAMAGPYRASFEFLETVLYPQDYERARPYHSWGTEYVYVIEDRGDFISLQHIIVMFVENEDGGIEGPFVQKHWRQDWQYEKPEILEYAGNNTWERTQLVEDEIEGTWAQAVYQVDDTPRYESHGEWRHTASFSTWRGGLTWRPLPRRESSARDDYQVLEARNVHTIVHNGWVHEEENYKVKLNEEGERTESAPYVAKEQGVNRYQRIVDFDFSAGDEYWDRTSGYWQDVRSVWERVLEDRQRIRIASRHKGVPLFMALFRAEGELTGEGGYNSRAGREQVRAILDDYVEYPAGDDSTPTSRGGVSGTY